MVRFILAFVICLIFPPALSAKSMHHYHPCKHGAQLHSRQQYAPLTLYDYIESKCPVKTCVDSEELKQITTEVSNDYGIDPLVLLAIITIESSFNIHARNGVNVGLAQVNLSFHRKEFAGADTYGVKPNVRIGASIYAQCLTKNHGSRNMALRCYNGGPRGDPKYIIKFSHAYQELSALVDLRTTG